MRPSLGDTAWGKAPRPLLTICGQLYGEKQKAAVGSGAKKTQGGEEGGERNCVMREKFERLKTLQIIL